MGSGAGSSYDMTRGNPWEPKKVAANFATMGGASVWSRSHDETTGKVVDAINSPAVLARKQAEEAARI